MTETEWVCVPREPTREMIEAWTNAFPDQPLAGLTDDEANALACRADWAAMIAAAPPAPAPPSVEAVATRLRNFTRGRSLLTEADFLAAAEHLLTPAQAESHD